MKIHQTLLPILLLIIISSCISNSQDSTNLDPLSLLKNGTYNFEEITYEAKELDTLVVNKFMAASASNITWFKQYMLDNAEKEDIPYHPNFGITEKEYKQYLEDLQGLQLKTVGKGKIKTSITNDIISFHLKNTEYVVFNKLKIDRKNLKAKWENIAMNEYSKIMANEHQKLIQFNGHKWKSYDNSQSKEKLLKESNLLELNIGKTISENSILLRLSISKIKNSKSAFNVEKILKISLNNKN